MLYEVYTRGVEGSVAAVGLHHGVVAVSFLNFMAYWLELAAN